jgi:hypothetical protein
VGSGVVGYQHPKYRSDTRGYRPEYDYYSLGVILMEIGFWKPFNEIAGFGHTYGAEHDTKFKERIPYLRQYMGRDYCEAIMACINGNFGPPQAEDNRSSNKIFVDFETKVLSRLNKYLI